MHVPLLDRTSRRVVGGLAGAFTGAAVALTVVRIAAARRARRDQASRS